MHSLDMPAGSRVRLTATARADVASHRWEVRVYAAGAASASPRLTYGSRIGGRDREQRIDIPAQEVDCQIEVEARHATAAGGWADDKLALLNDSPGRLDLGFSDPSQPIAQADDVRLSFVHTVP